MKKNLLFLHGALGSKNQFDSITDKFSPHFNTWTFNFSGHGGKKITHPFSIDLFTQELFDFIDLHKISECNIFGYSMGGYIALNFAQQYQLQGKIITLGTKFSWSPDIAAKEIKMLDHEKIKNKIPAFAEVLEKRHHPFDWKIVLDSTTALILQLGTSDSLRFEKIPNDVLIMIGSDDTMVSFEESENASEKLKKGKLLVLQNTAHPIESVNTSLLLNEINSFLK
jgi:pimeloyl-ACP methyl ester carboxylesterase